MTPYPYDAHMSEKPPAASEFTIDELAERAGMTVRNVRAYAGRGLIASPRLEGRTGYYSTEHLQRLQLVRALIDKGYTLAAVERTLLANPAAPAHHMLELLEALHAPVDEEPEVVTRDSLAALAGTSGDDSLIASLVDLGLIEMLDHDHVRVLQPAIVRAGTAAIAIGLAPATVLTILPVLQEHLDVIATHFVKQVREEIWEPFADAGTPDEDWPAMVATIESLLPVAAQAVLAVFRERLGHSIDESLQDDPFRRGKSA